MVKAKTVQCQVFLDILEITIRKSDGPKKFEIFPVGVTRDRKPEQLVIDLIVMLG